MARRLDPGRPGIHLGLARVAARRNHPTKARHHLQIELQCENHSTRQTLELARLLIDVKLPAPAIEALDGLLDTHDTTSSLRPPDRAAALYYRGIARLRVDQSDQGVRDLRRSLRIDGDNVAAMRHLVQAHLKAGRLVHARYWLGRALYLQPHNTHLSHLRRQLRFARLRNLPQRLRRRLRPSNACE